MKKQAWKIRVNGRLFEVAETKERRDEIVKILSDMYAEDTIEIKKTFIEKR